MKIANKIKIVNKKINEIIRLLFNYSLDYFLILHLVFLVLINNYILIVKDQYLFSWVGIYGFLIVLQTRLERCNFQKIKIILLRQLFLCLIVSLIITYVLSIENNMFYLKIYLFVLITLILYYVFNSLSNKLHEKNLYLTSLNLIGIGTRNYSLLDIIYSFSYLGLFILYSFFILC
jgi:hypothetical protein